MRVEWRLRRTTIITVGLLAFLVGLGLARFRSLDFNWVIAATLPLILFPKRRNLVFTFCVLLFALSIGWWRGSMVMQQLKPYQNLNLKKVVIIGTTDSDGVYDDKSQLSFDLRDATVVKPEKTKLIGKLKVTGYGVNMVYRGDRVQIEGKLFKTRGSRQASIGFADISVREHHNTWVDNVRRRFSAGMESALPEPLASFALGLLIGQRSTLPQEVNNRLSQVGLTHLVAVSGYNLTILAIAVRRVLGKRSKYQTTILSLVFIGLFLMITGLSASIVRAALVSMLSLAAWYYGRSIRPLLLLSLAAAITAGWNPIYLWSDIGWYLSFLAFFGVLVVAPLIAKRFSAHKEPRPLTMVFIESLSAQLMVAPLIMYIFGQVSIIGIVANLLVVPLVPYAMLASMIAGLGGMMAASISGWFALPARLLLTYMIDVVNLLSRVPHALAQSSLMLWQVLFLYFVVIFLCLVLWRRGSKNARITPVIVEE